MTETTPQPDPAEDNSYQPNAGRPTGSPPITLAEYQRQHRFAKSPVVALDEALDAVTEAFSGTSEGLAKTASALKRVNADLLECRSVLSRVNFLHESRFSEDGMEFCGHCSDLKGSRVAVPCPTMEAVSRAEE